MGFPFFCTFKCKLQSMPRGQAEKFMWVLGVKEISKYWLSSSDCSVAAEWLLQLAFTWCAMLKGVRFVR